MVNDGAAPAAAEAPTGEMNITVANTVDIPIHSRLYFEELNKSALPLCLLKTGSVSGRSLSEKTATIRCSAQMMHQATPLAGSSLYMVSRFTISILTDSFAVYGILLQTVIRRFLGNLDIVRMTFPQSCSGDADKPTVILKVWNIRGTAVTHARPYTANELIQDIG